MYITYADLIQLMIFIVALVGLCCTIFKGKNSRHYSPSDGCYNVAHLIKGCKDIPHF